MMSASHRSQISECLGAQPVLVHAADFGYVHRPRLFWGLEAGDFEFLFSTPVADCIELHRPDKLAQGLAVARWTGQSWPVSWTPEGGYTWQFRGQSGTRAAAVPGTKFAPTYATGRFLAFTAAWPRPADRLPGGQGDDFATQRFLDDGRLRPLASYAKGNVVWRGGDSRPLTPSESEFLMGLPPGCTEDLVPVGSQTLYAARLNAIGHAMHVPSVVLFLTLLLRSPPQVHWPATPVILPPQ